VRIETLPHNNRQTQGAERRAWLRQHAPQHLQHCEALILHALHSRSPDAAQNALVLGAGACTEVPLAALARACDEVVLADLDLAAMRHGRDELSSATLRKRVQIVQCDISGGVSARLDRLLRRQDWGQLAAQGAQEVFDVVARCLEQCEVPDPPAIPELASGSFGLVVSSLVLSQLFSYPLLDVLDHIQRLTPALLGEQERHRRYQEAAQSLRLRIIRAHVHLMRDMLDIGGCAALLSDVRGFAFNVHGSDHDAAHRRLLPLVPRTFPELVREQFKVLEEEQWEWISDLPREDRPGRGYEVVGYVLAPASRL
jgi:hypothetical protein